MVPIQSIPGFSEPFSCWSHLLAAVLSLVGYYWLWKRGWGSRMRITALTVYTFSLIFLFSMSGVYHLLEPGLTPRLVFRRLDHAAIWVLIAGTFTPIHMILFRGVWRWAILALVWTVAISGLVLEVIFFTSIPEWMALSFYLSLGWLGLLSGWHFKRSFKAEKSKYLVMGGVYYSIGAVLEFARWPTPWPGVIGPHEIFHVFVMLGAWSHWRFVYYWANHPVWNTITFHVRVFPEERYLASARGEHIQVEANSIEDLKTAIRKKVDSHFHRTLPPKIRLRFFQEEYLDA